MSVRFQPIGRIALWVFALIGAAAVLGAGYIAISLPTGHGKDDRQRYNILQLERALTLYHHHGSYPNTAQGLGALVGKPEIGETPVGFPPKGYLANDLPLIDEWGNPLQYESPGKHKPSYDLASWGADGKPGGTGIDADITNWYSEDAS